MALSILPLLFLAEAAAPRLVGYFPDHAASSYKVETLDFSRLTHIAWSFAYPDTAGNLLGLADANGARLDSLVKRAHAQGVKVLLSLGGGGSGSDAFPTVAASATARPRFAGLVDQAVRAHRLDGVDLDWEPPTKADSASRRLMVEALRDSLEPGKTLSMAVYSSDWYGRWDRVERVLDRLDWIGVMTYDLTGLWDALARYNSPLFQNRSAKTDWSVSQALAYWNGRGVPKDKILGGIPFYGFLFPKAHAPGDSSGKSATAQTYKAVQSLLSAGGWTTHWDSLARVPWASHPSQGYLTYDDPASVAAKGRWIGQNGYGGAIVWELTQDWSLPDSRPLLDSLGASLTGSVSIAGALPPPVLGVRIAAGRLWAGEPFEAFQPDGRALGASHPDGGEHVLALASSRGMVVVRTGHGSQVVALAGARP